jgi:hypothetical protein
MSKLTGGDDTLMQSLWRMQGKWSVRGRSMRWCTWEWGLNQSNEWLLLLGLMLEENNWSVSLLILPSTLPLAEFPCRMPRVRYKPDANMNPLHFDVELPESISNFSSRRPERPDSSSEGVTLSWWTWNVDCRSDAANHELQSLASESLVSQVITRRKRNRERQTGAAMINKRSCESQSI